MIVRGTALVCALIASGTGVSWARTDAPPVPDAVDVAALDPEIALSEQEEALPDTVVAQLPRFPNPRETGGVGSTLPGGYALPFDIDMRFRQLFRSDDLNWRISGMDGATAWASELTWDDVRAVGFESAGRIQLPNGFVLDGRANFAVIVSGDNQDSDFFDGAEMSRSNNDADDGRAWDATLGFGYAFDLEELTGVPATVTPLIGWAYHRQELRMNDGVQTISGGTPTAQSFGGLDSEYNASWHGPWVGIQLHLQPAPGWTFTGSLEYHRILSYDAEADWNLRADFSSFEQSATSGSGILLRSNLSYRVSGRWTFDVNAQLADFETSSGKDTIFWNGGGRSESNLEGVDWDTLQITLGARYQF